MTNDIQPPPLPTEGQWYFVQNGEKNGPTTTHELRKLLSAKAIDPETQVWRAGLRGWMPIRETELIEVVKDVPPPIAPRLVKNGAVWVVALLPLLFGFIDASIAHENKLAAWRTVVLGFPAEKIQDVPVWLNAVITLGFCLWDRRVLRKAGYPISRWLFLTALITPIYLFIRAKRVGQRPTYAIVWILTFILAVLLEASA